MIYKSQIDNVIISDDWYYFQSHEQNTIENISDIIIYKQYFYDIE